MKTLHLLRHAKSDWSDPALPDRDRGLNKRGRRDAPRMGAALSRRLQPMEVTCSPARRAQLTLSGVCQGWPALGELVHPVEETLYTFSCTELLQWLRAGEDDRRALFIVSHNPGLTDLVNILVGPGTQDNLPTAGYAQLTAPVSRWRDLSPGCAVLEYSLFPRQLPD